MPEKSARETRPNDPRPDAKPLVSSLRLSNETLLTSGSAWRGLDLNQRPSGYEV